MEALRDRCPVVREPHHDVMMVTGYEEAIDVLGDAERFSSCISVSGPFPGFPVPLEGGDVRALIDAHRAELPFSDQVTVMDPPDHTRHRALLMGLITPKRLRENEEFMWQRVDQVLQPYLAAGGGDYIGEFAGPFTLLVIADLLGVPEDDRAEFSATMTRQARGGGVGASGQRTMSHTPLRYLYDKFAAYIEDRRREPRGDTLSDMAVARFPDGSTPEVMDIVRLAANLYSAGQETTVRLLSSALMILAENRELQRTLRENPDRTPNFIEECLRFESPVKGDFRLAAVDTTVGGVDIPAGTTLMVMNGAANRDPRLFDDPATFDLARPNVRKHIAFGRGPHTCPGAPLARTEARVSIERLLAGTSDIRLSEDHHGPSGARHFAFVPTYILRGLTELHLEFDLAENAA
ncbi:cytochrome P450 [Nocardia sp. NPDC024068]|uniref:cytochrome P450 n=1 Tax=Nocardia sp. NPDC024068 TaxID=3157197 RepID=UPI0033F4416B